MPRAPRTPERRAQSHRLRRSVDGWDTGEAPRALPARHAHRPHRRSGLRRGHKCRRRGWKRRCDRFVEQRRLLRPDFLEQLVGIRRRARGCGGASDTAVRRENDRQRRADARRHARTVHQASWTPRGGGRSHRPVLVSPGGGADAYRRRAWLEAGGLDERLSFYGADVDLGLRIRSLGWTTVAAPDAVATHMRSATSGHRSRRARESGGWARGFLLRRWSILRTRSFARALVTEALVSLGDIALSRDTVAVRSRIEGWKCAGRLPRRAVPPGAVDPDIGFVESLRLRWTVR